MRQTDRARRSALVPILCVGCLASLVTLSPSSGAEAANDRFVATGRVLNARAEWLSVDGDTVVFGSGSVLNVARGRAAPVLRKQVQLGRAIEDGVLVGERLYLTGPRGGLLQMSIDDASFGSSMTRLLPENGNRLRLAQMDDYLVVAEDGEGLWILQLPAHDNGRRGHRQGHAHPGHRGPEPVARLALAGPFSAAAASDRRIYIGRRNGDLVVIDARIPDHPELVRRLDLGLEIVDLAANGETIYVLSHRTMRLVDIDEARTTIHGDYPIGDARAFEVGGRRLLFAAGERGVSTMSDQSTQQVDVNVTVGNNFFTPRMISINVGDTVNWNKSTTGLHNVESCDGSADPVFCGGEVATEGLFRSGDPTSRTFNFSWTFFFEGTNPYFCAVHVGLGMNGRVDVTSATTTPPAVPDGITGAPMTVNKLDAAADSLSISWDTSTCSDAINHHIVFGGGSQFPTTLGGVYGLLGGQCGLGTTSPFTWTNSPATTLDSSGLIWWLLLANDGEGTEGSWGKDGAANERAGPGAGGASGECLNTAKDVSNTCGQ